MSEYTLEEIAVKLEVHLETVRRWVRSGQLNAHHKAGRGRSWYVSADEYDRFVASASER